MDRMLSNKITEKHLPASNLMSAPDSMRNICVWFRCRRALVYTKNRDENGYGADACNAAGSRFKPGRRSVSVFVEKFIVEDGRCQFVRVFGFVNRVFGTNQAALAKDTTVLLSGDFFGHLED